MCRAPRGLRTNLWQFWVCAVFCVAPVPAVRHCTDSPSRDFIYTVPWLRATLSGRRTACARRSSTFLPRSMHTPPWRPARLCRSTTRRCSSPTPAWTSSKTYVPPAALARLRAQPHADATAVLIFFLPCCCVLFSLSLSRRFLASWFAFTHSLARSHKCLSTQIDFHWSNWSVGAVCQADSRRRHPEVHPRWRQAQRPWRRRQGNWQVFVLCLIFIVLICFFRCCLFGRFCVILWFRLAIVEQFRRIWIAL